jgi:DNA-binding MarR family transcriptional regulator
MVGLVRALGLHRPGQTPCGQAVAVAEAHALLELSREPGLSQNGLAARLRLEKSTVSRIVTLLERRGWIERKRDKSDTRIVHVHLTRDGRDAAANLAASRQAKFAHIFSAIPRKERAPVLAALDLLSQLIRDTENDS